MEITAFSELQLDSRILRAVEEMGFEEATPIQAQAIPVQMEGRDIVGQAQTGTGKTAAFGIPLLQKIDPKNKKIQAIALCPTRELAIQVAGEIRNLAKYMHGIKVLPIYGGQDITRQIRGLKDGTQIVIGTPGRVMDHMRRKTIRCDQIHTVIMDEADEMLNMGFLEDMETILSQLPEERQTVMFSATMPPAIQEIARRFQKDPVNRALADAGRSGYYEQQALPLMIVHPIAPPEGFIPRQRSAAPRRERPDGWRWSLVEWRTGSRGRCR